MKRAPTAKGIRPLTGFEASHEVPVDPSGCDKLPRYTFGKAWLAGLFGHAI